MADGTLKCLEPGHQKEMRNLVRAGDGQLVVGALADRFGGGAQGLQSGNDGMVILPSGLVEGEPAPVPLEEARCKLRFQPCDVSADRRLRGVELFRRAAEVAVPRSALEGDEGAG